MITIIVGRKGEQPFAINDPKVSGKHLEVTKLGAGKYQIKDLSSTNGTYVDGLRVISKVVDDSAKVMLGNSYPLNLSILFPEAASTFKPSPVTSQSTGMANPTKPQPKEYSIRHLEKVWNQYEADVKELKNKQKELVSLRSLAPVFTMGSGTLTGVSHAAGWGNGIVILTAILSLIGLVITVYAFVKAKAFDLDEQMKPIKDRMIKQYVCPNPDCHHFLGMKEYQILRTDTKCPYCQSKYKS